MLMVCSVENSVGVELWDKGSCELYTMNYQRKRRRDLMLNTQLRKEVWKFRSNMKRVGEVIINEEFGIGRALPPAEIKARVERLIGTSEARRADYLCSKKGVGSIFITRRLLISYSSTLSLVRLRERAAFWQ